MHSYNALMNSTAFCSFMTAWWGSVSHPLLSDLCGCGTGGVLCPSLLHSGLSPSSLFSIAFRMHWASQMSSSLVHACFVLWNVCRIMTARQRIEENDWEDGHSCAGEIHGKHSQILLLVSYSCQCSCICVDFEDGSMFKQTNLLFSCLAESYRPSYKLS